MPTYSYKCPVCGKVQDHFHGMNDQVLIMCCDKPCFKKIHMPQITASSLPTRFKPFHDRGSGDVIESPEEIKRREKAGQVYMTPEEHNRYAKKQRKEIEKKESERVAKDMEFYTHKLEKGEKCTDQNGSLIKPE